MGTFTAIQAHSNTFPLKNLSTTNAPCQWLDVTIIMVEPTDAIQHGLVGEDGPWSSSIQSQLPDAAATELQPRPSSSPELQSKCWWLLWTKSGLFRRQTDGRGNAAALKYLPWRRGRLSTTSRTSANQEINTDTEYICGLSSESHPRLDDFMRRNGKCRKSYGYGLVEDKFTIGDAWTRRKTSSSYSIRE